MTKKLTPKIILSLSLLMTSASYHSVAQTFSQVAKVVASDRRSADNLGNSVAVSGNYMVVAARNQDFDATGTGTSVTDAGAAYIYERNTTTGAWTQVQKIVASDRTATDQFGWSVAISGDHIVIGSWQQDKDAGSTNTMTDAGAAYIFERNNTTGTWAQVQKIVPSDRAANDKFGYSVSVSGDRIVVSAWWQDLDGSGANSVYNAGAAYIFDRDATSGVWAQTQKLVAADRMGNDQFGTSVSVDGDRIAVGAYQQAYDESGNNFMNTAGAAYLYERDAATGVWAQVQKIVASDRAMGDFYGQSVSVSGDRLAVGARMQDQNVAGTSFLSSAGAAYIYERNNTTGTWAQTQKIVQSDRAASDYLGFAVSMSGDRLAVSAYLQDLNATGGGTVANAGAAYIFDRNTTTGVWAQSQKLVASDRAANDNLGFSVAISGSKVVAGAHLQDQNVAGNSALTDAGAVYIYEATTDQSGKMRMAARTEDAYFRISPLPAASSLTIETNDALLDNTTATLVDVTGRKLKSFSINTGRQTISLDGLATGMYMLQLSNGSSYKLVKE